MSILERIERGGREPRTLWVKIKKRDFEALIEGYLTPGATD
jgi:hypothetical protein